MAGDEDARIVNAASLSKQLVERVLAERSRQVDLIASAPSIDRRRAQRRATSSRQRGLAKMGMAAARGHVPVDALAASRRARESISHRSASQARHRGSHGHRRIRVQRGDHVAVVGLRAERRRLVAERPGPTGSTAQATADSGHAAHGRRARVARFATAGRRSAS